MIYLDTHVAVWLYAFGSQKLSEPARKLIAQSATILISPMVLLEMEFLLEIGRLTVSSQSIYGYLVERIPLEVCEAQFDKIIKAAVQQTWTRDPFDRIITAQATMNSSILITKDRSIRDNYNQAIW